MIELLDVVTLTVDMPDEHLQKGQVGTIVEVLAPNTFEVEFSDYQRRHLRDGTCSCRSTPPITLRTEPVYLITVKKHPVLVYHPPDYIDNTSDDQTACINGSDRSENAPSGGN